MNDYRIGILGGGQLGKMLCLSGGEMDLNISILEREKNCPAGPYCRNLVVGDINSYDDVVNFGKCLDVLTIEIEKVNIDAIKDLENHGLRIYPTSSIIEVIQDKGVQKQFLVDHNIPTSAFEFYNNESEIEKALTEKRLSYPFVQKLRKDGYDGRGVIVCQEYPVGGFFKAPSIVEEKVEIKKELAVIVCRNAQNEIAIYDPVEMVFDPIANLLDYQIAPARIDDELVRRTQKIAYDIAEKLELIGILAIEMFLTTSNVILVNEMAPRPHNSGHHTIEACMTSQYENLLRILTNQPLGQSKTIHPSLLINLVGSDGYAGECHYSGVHEIMSVHGSHLHLYGKKMTKPKRKMGHVTILSDEYDRYSAIVKSIKSHFSTEKK